MKKILSAIALFCCLALTATAQQLRVHQGTVTYVYPGYLLETMTYSDGGQTLTILGRSFSTAEIDSIKVTNVPDIFTPNSINVDYAGDAIRKALGVDVTANLKEGKSKVKESKATKQRLTVIEPGYQYKDKNGNIYTLYGDELEEDDTGIVYD